MFADSVRVVCVASPRPDWRRPTHSLPVSCRRCIRLVSVERLHHGIWSSSRRCVPPPQQTLGLLLARSTVLRRTAEDADDKLFNKLCNNSQHSLHYLLPNLASQITISVPLYLTTDNYLYLHAPDTWLMPNSLQDYCIKTVTDLWHNSRG